MVYNTQKESLCHFVRVKGGDRLDDNTTRFPVIWRWRKVSEVTGLKPSTMRNLEKKGIFPRRVAIGPKAVGWISSEIEDWIRERIKIRDEHEQ